MIGIYDSGVGGLAVLREVRTLLTQADLVYLADQANLPYGERPLSEVRSLAEKSVGRLVGLGADTVVVACNTASAAAIHHLRETFPAVRIVGMEPAVKPAAVSSRRGRIGVLATPATFAAAGFDELVGRHAAESVVFAHPCPGWADAVEEGWPEDAAQAVSTHLRPLLEQEVDTLVLACTHYSFLAGVIAAAAGTRVSIIDPVPAVARQTVRVAGADGGSGSTTYLTTDNPARLRDQVARLLGEEVEVGVTD